MNISGIECRHTELRCLRPILKRWIDLNGELAKLWLKQEDCPWWYKERALLSTFTGAVWLSGHVALEEYSDFKRTRSMHGRLSHESYTGRVDLYFEAGKWRFVAESKHVWIAATKEENQTVKVQSCIRETCGDARRSRPDKRFRRLAIVFAVPYIRVKKGSRLTEGELKEKILWSIDQVQQTKCDLITWSFPKLGAYGKYGEGVCPGVIVIIKKV